MSNRDHGFPYVNGRWQPKPAHAPIVMGMVVVAAVLAWMTGLGQQNVSALFLIVDPRYHDVSSFDARLVALLDTLASGQVWRLISPDFLHFSWSHLIFNAVILWFLGSQVEWLDGKKRFLVLFVATSLGANLLQYMMNGPFFGGLSGVVYGVLGYCWLSQQQLPRFQFPPALMIFAVVWMLLGFTALPEVLGIGRMANEAHLGGLLTGLALAALPPIKKAPRSGA